MKDFLKLLIVGASTMALVMACEPGEGDDDATSTATGGDTATGDGDGTGDGTGSDPFTVVEIEDDPNNSTLDPCDTGTIKSPGADIDAAELLAGSNLVGNLDNCTLMNTGGCENDSGVASQAEGTPDASGSEETGTYTSLNGGFLRCQVEGGAAIEGGQDLTVFEIGGTSGTNVEQYTVRFCKSLGGNCTSNANFASGESTFSTDSLL